MPDLGIYQGSGRIGKYGAGLKCVGLIVCLHIISIMYLFDVVDREGRK